MLIRKQIKLKILKYNQKKDKYSFIVNKQTEIAKPEQATIESSIGDWTFTTMSATPLYQNNNIKIIVSDISKLVINRERTIINPPPTEGITAYTINISGNWAQYPCTSTYTTKIVKNIILYIGQDKKVLNCNKKLFNRILKAIADYNKTNITLY